MNNRTRIGDSMSMFLDWMSFTILSESGRAAFSLIGRTPRLSVLQPDSADGRAERGRHQEGADDWASVQTLTPPKAAGSPRAILQVRYPQKDPKPQDPSLNPATSRLVPGPITKDPIEHG